MTFKDFAEKAKALRQSGDSFSLQVEVWLDGEGFRSLKWTIYSSTFCKHFSAETPEEVFELLAGEMNPKDPKGLAEVGEVEVP